MGRQPLNHYNQSFHCQWFKKITRERQVSIPGVFRAFSELFLKNTNKYSEGFVWPSRHIGESSKIFKKW